MRVPASQHAIDLYQDDYYGPGYTLPIPSPFLRTGKRGVGVGSMLPVLFLFGSGKGYERVIPV